MLVPIEKLRITYEDEWLKKYVELFGDSVCNSPNHQFLYGNSLPLRTWMDFRGMDWTIRARELDDLRVSIAKEGQKEPIFIYWDFRINTGHKRAAVMLRNGLKEIDCVVVPQDYKL